MFPIDSACSRVVCACAHATRSNQRDQTSPPPSRAPTAANGVRPACDRRTTGVRPVYDRRAPDAAPDAEPDAEPDAQPDAEPDGGDDDAEHRRRPRAVLSPGVGRPAVGGNPRARARARARTRSGAVLHARARARTLGTLPDPSASIRVVRALV